MFHVFRNVHRSGTAKTTAAILLTTFIGVAAVHADDKKIDVTIKSKTPVTVKFKDAANKQFNPEIKANDPQHISIDPRTKTIQWEAFANSTKCDGNTLSISGSTATIEVTKCVDKAAEGTKAEEAKKAEQAKKTEQAKKGQQNAECPVNERRSDMSCPPKSAAVKQLADLKAEGEDAVKALEKAKNDLKGVVVNPKDPKAAMTTIKEIAKRYNDAKKKINHYKIMLGHEPDDLIIDYNKKLPDIEKDLYAELKKKLAVFGCEWTQTSGDLDMDKLAACEGKMDVGGGRK